MIPAVATASLIASGLSSAPALAQFQLAESVQGLLYSGLAWGDYDADGDLDLAVVGRTPNPGSSRVSRIYRNLGGFLTLQTSLLGAYQGSVSWGDRDGDGFVDPFITGIGTSGGLVARLYGGPGFNDTGEPFSLLGGKASAWGDYDNDGDLDLFLAGYDGVAYSAKVFRNTNGTFAADLSLNGMSSGDAEWGDYDNDGDLDLAVNGYDGQGQTLATIYRNSGGAAPTLTDIGAGLFQIGGGSVAWGDYDNDGDLDLLLTGTGGAAFTALYRNSGGANPTFSLVTSGFLSVRNGAARWGDYDNDGLLDVVLAGESQSGIPLTRVYRNLGGSPPAFLYVQTALPGIELGDVAWGDWDADGDLDIAITGTYAHYELSVTDIYANTAAVSPNMPPAAPAGLSAISTTLDGQPAIQFSWDPATDDVTPQQTLTYNLRVGTTPGGGQVAPPLSIGGTGHRLIPAPGNTGFRTTWTLRVPLPGTYYWSVQAIDGGFAGSAFAPEQIVNATVSTESQATPEAFNLSPAAPNPFRQSTAMSFEMPRAASARLEVFDPAGRLIRVLAHGRYEAGRHSLAWDGVDASGRQVPTGVYLVRMKSGAFEASRPVVMMR